MTSRASRAANKTAASTPAPQGATVTQISSATGRSATGDNRTAAKPAPAKSVALTPTAQKRIVADAMCKAVADMLARWPAKSGVAKEDAALWAAGYLNYAPVQTWDPCLPKRSGAGGRGAKARKSA